MNLFPEIATKRIAVKVRSKAERHIKEGHPWVFDESIEKENHPPRTGDLAIIFDQKKNQFLACGLYDLDSPIRIKLLQFKKGRAIDASWFKEKVAEAFTKRAALLKTDTNSFRLIYGENDGFPGVICDVYDECAVLKLYSGAWFPYMKLLVEAILACVDLKCIVLRLSRNTAALKETFGFKNGDVIFGVLENEEVVFKEHGIYFSANLIHGHKTGYFLDHRHNRKRVGELAQGKEVLDVFAYAGGFSVHALCGGANRVVSLDISAQALEMAKKNANLNGVFPQHQLLVGDAFEQLSALKKNKQIFDIVVVDPPSFAKKASEVAGAIKAYERLLALAYPLVRKGGILVFASCSSRLGSEDFFELVEQGLKRQGLDCSIFKTSFHDVDHPISFPEGAYLKCIYCLID
ncbi:MAG: class I SAM-dependent rRNA methyltransferase [Bacteroidetes bacterium]|nr:class I SAM-dependent rRNA methyltransferase [Bacteroidota bacterium]